MERSLKKAQQLRKRELFDIRESSQATILATSFEAQPTKQKNTLVKKALLEAERKKAEALTVLKHCEFR
jgi:hypothetical protein